MFDDESITVYQAFGAAIAAPAAANNSFVGTPFKLERMTWIKPSFLWMMYRSGWATKPGQEHVLEVKMSRTGFEEALSLACLSHFDADVYEDYATWARLKESRPVRVQWDPERNAALEPLPWRSLQVGLSGPVVHDYVNRWIVEINDITELVRSVEQLQSGPDAFPGEKPYPLPAHLKAPIGAS